MLYNILIRANNVKIMYIIFMEYIFYYLYEYKKNDGIN